MSAHKSSSSRDRSMSRFEEAHVKTVKARAALAPESVVQINLEVNIAAATVLGLTPGLRELREEVAALPGIDLAKYDKIELYAEALAQSQANFVLATAPAEPLPALAARAIELRDQLTADAKALARRNLIDGSALSDALKGGTGHLNAGVDLGALASMLRGHWAEIQGQTAITSAELDEAQKLFEDIMQAYGERAHSPERVAGVTDDRARAFTLFMSAYDQARRAISFLRWEQDDADDLAPSLYSGRNRGAAAPKPVAPPPDVPATPTAPITPVAANPTTPATTATTATPTTNGMPGGSPFAHN